MEQGIILPPPLPTCQLRGVGYIQGVLANRWTYNQEGEAFYPEKLVIKIYGNLFKSKTSKQNIALLGITDVITYRAKLLNADWFRQRAFFLNFPLMAGKIT